MHHHPDLIAAIASDRTSRLTAAAAADRLVRRARPDRNRSVTSRAAGTPSRVRRRRSRARWWIDASLTAQPPTS
jgi:hypothetical protein